MLIHHHRMLQKPLPNRDKHKTWSQTCVRTGTGRIAGQRCGLSHKDVLPVSVSTGLIRRCLADSRRNAICSRAATREAGLHEEFKIKQTFLISCKCLSLSVFCETLHEIGLV